MQPGSGAGGRSVPEWDDFLRRASAHESHAPSIAVADARFFGPSFVVVLSPLLRELLLEFRASGLFARPRFAFRFRSGRLGSPATIAGFPLVSVQVLPAFVVLLALGYWARPVAALALALRLAFGLLSLALALALALLRVRNASIALPVLSTTFAATLRTRVAPCLRRV